MASTLYRLKRAGRRIVPRLFKRAYVRAAVRWQFRHAPGPNDSTPRISFAGILPPPGTFVRGGKVKLTHLRKRYGEFRDGCNILYLVSSTLPAYPDIWVSEAHRRGIKVVWSQNGVGCPAWAPETWKAINTSMLSIRDADFVAYQSAFAKEGADLWVSRTEAPYAIVTNCIDTTLFSPARHTLPPTPLRLLVMGTHMTPEKVFIPLEALASVVRQGIDATLSIIGPCEFPDAERRIEQFIASNGLRERVQRAGRFLQHEAPDLYRAHHVFLHMKHMDSSPTAILEAMACGLSVIGSGSGGLLEWIPDTAGILLPVAHDWHTLRYPSSQSVADAVMRIGRDWPVWSAAARANAISRFDVNDWLNAHARIFATVLGVR